MVCNCKSSFCILALVLADDHQGNFFLVFRILTTSLGDENLLKQAGTILGVVFEWLYLATLLTCFVLALGNRPQGSNKFYMTMVYFWGVIMVYLIFASIYITTRSIQITSSQPGFTVGQLFSNSLFQTLIVSLASTYIMWFVAAFLFFDPWHMFTSVSPKPRFSPILSPNFRTPWFASVQCLTEQPVHPIPPPHPNLHQHPQRLRLLQHPRHHLGYQG